MAVFAPANVPLIGLDSVAAEGVNAESFGADPNASAALNTTAIQAALNKTGLVTLTTPGTYLISDTLVISSNTYFQIGPNVTIKLAPNTLKAMLIPASWLNYLTPTTITIAWTAGALATVTWAGHGMTTRDYVYIKGATQSEYNNVFPVLSTPTADTFTIALLRTPTTTATGTITALKCTREFVVEGGTWDFDLANNTNPAGGFNRDCFGIFAAANFEIKNCAFINFRRGITSGALADYQIRNCTYDTLSSTASEGHKTYGPINGGLIQGLVIRSTDDGMSVQPKESVAFTWTGFPFGDIYNLTIDACDVQSSGNPAAGAFPVYISTSEIIENLRYKNCVGYSEQGSGFIVKYGDEFAAAGTGKANSIYIQGMNVKTGTPASQFPFSIAALVDLIEIDGLTPVNGDLTNILIRQQSTSTIKVMKVKNLRFVNSTWPSSAGTIFNQVGIIENLEFDNCQIAGNASQTQWYSLSTTAAGALKTCTFSNCNFSSGARMVLVNSTVTAEHSIVVRNCHLKSITSAFEMRSTAITNLFLMDNFFDTITNLVRPTTTAGICGRVYGNKNQFVSVTNALAGANSATVEVYNWDFPIDPAGVTGLATTNGQYCTSTNATANKQGPAVRAFSINAWYALATGVAGVNTAI
jgi:hypothetical protein